MEFGSDFHFIENYSGIPKEPGRKRVYFADGRMALTHILKKHGIKRLWVPQYFCYEVLNNLIDNEINWITYPDYPEENDTYNIEKIPFEIGDGLLRMNFFGLRDFRDNMNIPVPVIEDHSHGILSDWAYRSNADFCVASLRKSIPLPEGGVAWSPKNWLIPEPVESSEANTKLVEERFSAMRLKAAYLKGEGHDKETFRTIYLRTEEDFSNLKICGMSVLNRKILDNIDNKAFDSQKKDNWQTLILYLNKEIKYLHPESEKNTPFSLVLKFDNKPDREKVRKSLIDNKVYPAILWQIPEEDYLGWPFYLSIHCDGRYNKNDMRYLAQLINYAYGY